MTPRTGLMVSALLLLPGIVRAQTTSTLTAETGDNTSVGTFPQHDNGNVAAGNVSKLDLHSLLYPGATTKIYAHVMPWFCTPGSANCSCTTTSGVTRCNSSSHILTGYNSNDATEVKKQVDDMISRGIQGVIIPWYGSTKPVQSGATSKFLTEAASRSPLFEFAIMETTGSGCAGNTTCVINDLKYFSTNFYGSPAYMRRSGRPVVFVFTGLDTPTAIDWNQVRTSAPGNPLFLFEDGFSHAQTDGAFAWDHPAQTVQQNLDYFYGQAQSHRSEIPVGAGYKGFDDRYATWAPSPPRFLDQGCGQTWLESFAVAGSYWSSSDQLANLQLVTWNDYDEGTEMESGVDNCLSISATLGADGKTLSWSLAGSGGQESTIDRYRIWSTPTADGQNLTLRAEVTAGGAHSYDLSTLPLTQGTPYTIYAQALGKPTILSHMANGVAYTPSGGTTGFTAGNVDDSASWQSCTNAACCGGGGGATTTLVHDAATSQDGNAARFDLGGSTAYSNARWWNQVATTSAAFHFTLDFWAYVTAPSAPQAFEFDFDQVIGGQRYKFSHQCDFKDSGLWRVWANGGWTATGRACVPFTANSWNHFIFHGERTADGRIHYQDMALNNVTYAFDLYAMPTAAGADSVTVYIQLDGNGNQNPYSLWIDELTLTGQ